MNTIRATVSLVAVLFLAAVPVPAGPAVNFSGTWELDKERSTLSPRLSQASSGEVRVVITHEGDTLKIERHVKMMGMQRTFASTYYTDGREATNLTPRGDRVISRSHWEGSSLVSVHRGTVTLEGKKRTVETTDVRQLAEDGKLLVVDSTARWDGEAEPERSHLVFVRK